MPLSQPQLHRQITISRRRLGSRRGNSCSLGCRQQRRRQRQLPPRRRRQTVFTTNRSLRFSPSSHRPDSTGTALRFAADGARSSRREFLAQRGRLLWYRIVGPCLDRYWILRRRSLHHRPATIGSVTVTRLLHTRLLYKTYPKITVSTLTIRWKKSGAANEYSKH